MVAYPFLGDEVRPAGHSGRGALHACALGCVVESQEAHAWRLSIKVPAPSNWDLELQQPLELLSGFLIHPLAHTTNWLAGDRAGILDQPAASISFFSGRTFIFTLAGLAANRRSSLVKGGDALALRLGLHRDRGDLE